MVVFRQHAKLLVNKLKCVLASLSSLLMHRKTSRLSQELILKAASIWLHNTNCPVLRWKLYICFLYNYIKNIFIWLQINQNKLVKIKMINKTGYICLRASMKLSVAKMGNIVLWVSFILKFNQFIGVVCITSVTHRWITRRKLNLMKSLFHLYGLLIHCLYSFI